MSNSLLPHGLQHTRPPCPSPTPRVYPNSCPLSQLCHPTISSSVVPFSSCLQSFPASFPTPWTAAYQAPPSVGFSRQEYWSGVPLPSLDSILKSRDITLPTNVHLVKAMFFQVVFYRCESWTIKRKLSHEELMLLNCSVGDDSWESLGLQGHPTSPS